MWRLEVEKDGTVGEPLLSGHTKDVDDGSLSPTKGDRRMKGKSKRRSFLYKHYMLAKRIMKVLTPYYSKRNPKQKRAWFLSFLMLVLLVAESIVLLYFSYAQREFSTALSRRDNNGFWRGVRKYIVVILVATPVFSLSFFVQGWLILDCRRSMIKCLTRLYFHNENFYRLKCLNINVPGFRSRMNRVAAANYLGDENQGGALDTPFNPIDNPDARIVNDVRRFAKNLVDISSALIGKSFSLLMFIVVLFNISKYATLLAVLYSVSINFITVTLYSRRLTHLSFVRSKKEANFQYGLVRVKEHAEEVAFYRGGEQERFQSNSLLQEVVNSSLAYLLTDSQAKLLQNWCLWSTSVVPYVIVAGKYLCGDEEFGIVTQTVMAFRTIVSDHPPLLKYDGRFANETGCEVKYYHPFLCILYISQNVKKFASLAADADRLHFLMVVLEDLSCVDTLTSTTSYSHEEVMWEEEPRLSTVVGGLRQRVNAFTRSLSGVKQHSSNLKKQNSTNDVSYPSFDMGIREEKSPAGKNKNKSKLVANKGAGAEIFYGEENSRKGQLVYKPALPQTVLSIKSLSVHTPDGSTKICSNLSFTLRPGERLLLEGQSGCGKSSLLRCLAGLWRDGSGTIYSSNSQGSIMFLPQKPYIPLGSLYELVVYPEVNNLSKGNEVEQALVDAGLSYIIERNGGLSSVRDWSDELSVGEQQRVGFARLFLARPSLAVLDESTSALEMNAEKSMYKEIIKRCSAVVSVGHKSSLYAFHTHVLYHEVDEDWRFMTVSEYKAGH